jgi:hypothetical protein
MWDKLQVNGTFCIGNTCITEDDLKKLKNNTFPSLTINGGGDYPLTFDRPPGTTLIKFNRNRALGFDGNNNLWNGNGWWFS